MTAKRNSKKRRASKVSDFGNLFRSLASAIASAQVSQKPILKRLLCLLGHASLTQPVNWENCDVASHCWHIKLSGEQVDLINFDDVCYLSDVLFIELDKSFKNLFSDLFNHKAETCPTFATAEESIELATLFLRCCMKIMTLLMPKQEMVVEKAKTLLSILSELVRARDGDCSFVFTHDGSLDPRHTFLCTGIEVFMDEILVNKSIRYLLFLVVFLSSSCRLFSKHDRGGVVEMVSAHFIISTSDEKTNKMCVERLYWKKVKELSTPQISLYAAASLLLNPVMFSAPRMIHAYVVLLVSDAIGICSHPSVKGLDPQLDRYIDAFEKSVVLYSRHMCKSENASHGKFGVLTSNARVAFENLILPSTLARVNDATLKLKDSWGSYQRNNAKRENNELVAYSAAYINESLCIFDSSCTKNMLSQIVSVLGCVILRASSDDIMDSVLQKYNASSMEDLYLLASTLKLMSCSMLQAIRVLRNWNRHHQSEALGDVRACKEYKAMMDVVLRFEQFSVQLPGQSFLRDRMESNLHRNMKSKWMLMHFSGLLSVSFALKLDFLVKDSIFGMMVALYLFILEGGDLEALWDSVCHSENPLSATPSTGSKNLAASGKAEEAAVDRKQSGAIASKFHKMRTLYLGKVSEAKDPENGQDSGVCIEEESCNGERFLWCIAGEDNLKQTDVDELADFIECEPGKDYSDWLKGRERFRKQRWKSDKIARHRWNKKQKAWRESKGRVSKS